MPRLLAEVAPAAVAQEPPSAVALPVDEAPAVDGRLDEAAWSEAPAIGDFVQREPIEGSSVSQPTEVRILTDGDALCVGAWLYDDDPSAIVFGETLRDASLGEADAFSLIFDTYHDRQNGFLFATTPAGIEYDAQVTNEGQGGGRGRQQRGSGGGFNLNWDGYGDVLSTSLRVEYFDVELDEGSFQTSVVRLNASYSFTPRL